MAFAFSEKGARYDLANAKASAKKAGNGWTLQGEKVVVLGAPAAGKLVVSANTPAGLSLFLVEAKAAKLRPYRTLDEMRAADVVLQNTPGELLGAEGKALPVIEAVVDFGTALICAEAVGAMKFSCDTTLEYLKTRKQFGVPIGTFQALQHRIVDMYVAYEQAQVDGVPRLQPGGLRGGREGAHARDLRGQDQGRGQRAPDQPGGDPAARRHGHDRRSSR